MNNFLSFMSKKFLIFLFFIFSILSLLFYTIFYENKSMSDGRILINELKLPELQGVSVEIGEIIDKKHTCEGKNINPRIVFPKKGVYAIIVEDPDAPVGTWFHWGIIVWDTNEISEGIKKELEGKNFYQTYNDFYYSGFLTNNIVGKGYDGPCPPKGHGYHRYFFEIFELKNKPEKPIREKEELIEFIKNNAISSTFFVGKYKR